MKLLVLLNVLVSWCSSQLIYPDQLEMMRTSSASSLSHSSAAAQPKQAQAPVPEQSAFLQNAFPVASAAAAAPLPAAQSAIPLQQPWDTHVNDIISRGIMKFTLDMDHVISNTNENVIFSPLSLAGALTLVLLGSSGRTFDEVSRILGLEAGVDISRHSEVVHQMFGALLSKVDVTPNSYGPQTAFASGIFVQDGYPIRPEFRAISQRVYKSEVINLDFRNQGGEAEQAINSWVNQRTRGKIMNILNDVPRPETNVIIASALYFNGEWNQYFIDGATRRKSFTVSPGKTIEVDMMYNAGEFPFYEDKQLQGKIVSLPYKGGDVTMYVVLPNSKEQGALRNLKSRLNRNVLESWIDSMRNQTCIIGLPRMKLSSTLSLSKALQSLGLTSLFDPEVADLSILSPGLGINSGSSILQAQPQRPVIPQQNLNSQSPSQDTFIFPRFGENSENGTRLPGAPTATSTKKDFFRYEDKVGRYRVEQWATGFTIKRIRRAIREKQRNERLREQEQGEEEKKKVDNVKAKDKRDAPLRDNVEISRKRAANLDKRFAGRTKRRTANLGQDNHHFEGQENTWQRHVRQVRPIDGDFLKYLEDQNVPSFGLDALRMSASLRNPGLYAEDVLHKVEIEVTEKGTEAAGATSIILTKDGSQKRLVADHPFLFFIRHEPTKLLLFWGTVNTPTPNFPRS
ncbi:leukocyte elastase inhibitor isoform X2 [Cephus cinctus]|nr:leukocyte elastase inhibitor isoform X2 [Cephus cinctus]